jgi:hypothetical protein
MTILFEGWGLLQRIWEGRGAHCRSLRSRRDDKGEGGASSQERLVVDWNSRSLHFATLRSG